jgi:type IX secretion system PorP/SprF family membrane protein
MRRFLFLLAILISAKAMAQITAPLPRLYWESNLLYNTAASNTENKRNAFLGLSLNPARFGSGIMWLGYTHPLKNGKHILGAGLGSFFMSDGLYNYTQDWFNLSYTYNLKLAEKSDLRFGTDVKYMINEFSSMWDIGHIIRNSNQIALNFSTFYTLNNFYAGVSLNNPFVKTFNKKFDENKMQALSYFTAGYKFSLEKHKIEMAPRIMLRTAYGYKNFLVDINNSLIFADILTLGASYREFMERDEERDFSLNIGVKIKKKFTASLAADITQQAMYNNSLFGGGECILNYAF